MRDELIGIVNTVKLPPFWHDDPQSFFAMAELKFALHKVTSDTSKFQLVASNFDAKLVSLCRDLILDPPERDKYSTLKRRILSALSPSQESNIRRLLHGQPLGSEKPTVYLQQLRNMATDQVGEALLRTLFLEQMPEDIRRVLVIGAEATLDQLAAQADKMLEMSRPALHQMSSQRGMQYENQSAEPWQAVMNRLDKLEASVKQQRARSSSRGRNHSHYRSPSSAQYCFYHIRFGELARKCREPCNWKQTPKPTPGN